MTTRRLVGLAVIACAALAGCIQPIYEEAPASTDSGKMIELTDGRVLVSKGRDQPSISLAVGDEKKFAEMLQQHRGKVVFVDFWATWCGPCVKAFPHTVETHHKYKDKDFATVAVSFDLLEDEPKVREFLAEQGASFENLLSNYDDVGTAVGEAFEFTALPEFRLYDRAGKLRYEWTAKPEDLDQRIEELLAEQATSE